jgi:single-stranded-DNA-specific exonuclease
MIKLSTYNLFKEYVKLTAEKFKLLNKKEPIRLITHLDSDGISAVSIFTFILNKLKFKYSVSVISQLDEPTINMLSNENYKSYIFIDLGSGQLKSIVSKFNEKNVFILDHHHPENSKINSNIVHINPMLFGINGSKEISASGIVYYFCKNLYEKTNSLSHLALIGAVGDQQYNNNFLSLNQDILNEAIDSKKIIIEKGIRFFGTQTRPIHKLLEYSTDPYIPSVTGSYEGTIDFLNSLGIKFKTSGNYRKLNNLTNDEMKLLIKGIVKKRRYEKNPKDIYGDIITINAEDKDSPYKDIKEFSTILNACGRLGKGSLGIAICMGSSKAKKEGVELLKRYKQEILQALKWYEKNKNTKYIIKTNKYIIINAQANIKTTLIGTIASMISFSSESKTIKYIITMAQNVDSTTKISLRFSGNKKEDIDLRILIKKIMKNIPGEYGGHKNAAGAIIKSENEEKFIKTSEEILSEINN